MKVRTYSFISLLILLLIPSAALADGVSPILNFFHKDTWFPASIVTLVIILVEGGLIRWRVGQTSWARSLWVSLVINLASSSVGSILLLAFGRGSFFMWDTMSMVLPLFLITLATEIPLLHTLLKQIPISWRRASVLGIGINLVSYAVVFAIEIGLLFAWLSYAGHQDRKELAEWQNPRLLGQMTGVIYATESKGGTHKLRSYDIRTQKWVSISNSPSFDPNKWDIKGLVFVFEPWNTDDWKNRRLVISRLPDFSVIHEIGLETFMDHQFDSPSDWQGVVDLALSPDAKRLAILFRYSDTVAYKDRSSFYALGSKCKLVIIDVDSGKELARAPRWASDFGLCWLGDGRTILFSSFNDEKLYDTQKSEVRGDTSYGIGYSEDEKFSQSIFAYSPDTGGVARFADGHNPVLVSHKGLVLVREGFDTLRLLDSSGKERSRIKVPRLWGRGVVISPDGSLILAGIQRHSPFYAGGVPLLFNISNPDIRHVLNGDFSYKYKWIEGSDSATNQVGATRN